MLVISQGGSTSLAGQGLDFEWIMVMTCTCVLNNGVGLFKEGAGKGYHNTREGLLMRFTVNRGHQFDVRIPTRWRLSLSLLKLPHWRKTAQLRGALCLARNWVRNVQRMSCRISVPRDGGGGEADSLYWSSWGRIQQGDVWKWFI